MPDPVRLNIGCGNKLLEGYVNIDMPGNYSGQKPDIECDIREIPLPDNHADEAMAIHVIEHFYRWEAVDVLKEWVRVLKPGGLMVIECPCLDKVIQLAQVPDIPWNMTMWRLYGDPSYKAPEMVHRWCYSVQELAEVMSRSGLKGLAKKPPQYHVPLADMRIEGIKA